MSHSRVQCFNGCPAQYQYKYIEGLELIEKTEYQNDSAFGTAIHRALQVHYQGESVSKVKEAFKEAYPADLSPADEAKSLEGGLACVEAYIEHYREIDKDWRVIETEVKDTVLNGEDSHNLVVDLIAEHIPSRTIYAWDHKTVGAEKMKYGFWKRYETDAQVTMYTEYIKQKYGSCAGFYVNAIAVGHRKRMYKGEPAGYYQRFERNIFERSQEQIDAWKKSDSEWKALMDYAMANGSYPKALNGLCVYCEFQQLCLSADNEQVKEIMYQKKQRTV